ncbi:MAG: DUF882 domain-containing protein [Bdellovibrionales bacterium]|jgi:uncharacterized protein YcbK (DUF882 family)|nr:DUF882 domain-containing protein [Bdellovibrionales bacterium]
MLDLMEKNALAAEAYDSDRRGFLKAGLFTAAALGFWTPALAQAAVPNTGRIIRLQNPYTGEKFTGEYWYNGKYIPAAFAEIKKLMRDHRANEQFPIDPRLMDILFVMHVRIKNAAPFDVLSGYRSPATNARLRRRSEGVARNSLHMTGQAIDLRLQGTRLTSLRSTAIDLKAGGVGFYPRSNFVHVDTGRVRHW